MIFLLHKNVVRVNHHKQVVSCSWSQEGRSFVDLWPYPSLRQMKLGGVMQKGISLPSGPFSNDFQLRNLSGLGREVLWPRLLNRELYGNLNSKTVRRGRAEPKLGIFSEFRV